MALLLLYMPVPEFQQPWLLIGAGRGSVWLQRVTKMIKKLTAAFLGAGTLFLQGTNCSTEVCKVTDW